MLDLDSTNALIRRLQDNPELRLICGFSSLPHRTTFNRFIIRLGDHLDLVDSCLAALTDKLADILPGFGENVAIDSTVVVTHSNPNRRNKTTGECSDPEASWTAKRSEDRKNELDWFFGYKLHMIADANYGLPIGGYTTTASCSDFHELPVLLDKARAEHGWFGPRHVMADRGYDSRANHEAVIERDAVPVIAIRKPNKRGDDMGMLEGIYTPDGRPTCIGLAPMQYVGSDPRRGQLFRCPPGGCHLRDRKGVRYCQDEEWLNRKDNPRLFGQIPRWSREWKQLYRLRQSVERVFKSMKESRRLAGHYIRGFRKLALHAAMSTLAFSATALHQFQAGSADARWMVRRVA